MFTIPATFEWGLGIEVIPRRRRTALIRTLVQLAAFVAVAMATTRIDDENTLPLLGVVGLIYVVSTAWIALAVAIAERGDRVEWLWSRGGVTRQALAQKSLRNIALSSAIHGLGITTVLQLNIAEELASASVTALVLAVAVLQYNARSSIANLVHSRRDTRLGSGFKDFWWIGYSIVVPVNVLIALTLDDFFFDVLRVFTSPWALALGAALCIAQSLLLRRAMLVSEFSTPDSHSESETSLSELHQSRRPTIALPTEATTRAAAEHLATPPPPVQSGASGLKRERFRRRARRRPYSPLRTIVGAGSTDPIEHTGIALCMAFACGLALAFFSHDEAVRFLAMLVGILAIMGSSILSWRGVFGWSRDPEQSAYLYQCGVSLTKQIRVALIAQTLVTLPIVVFWTMIISTSPREITTVWGSFAGIGVIALLLRSLHHCNIQHWSTRVVGRAGAISIFLLWAASGFLGDFSETYLESTSLGTTIRDAVKVSLSLVLLALGGLALSLWARAILTSSQEERLKRKLWDSGGHRA